MVFFLATGFLSLGLINLSGRAGWLRAQLVLLAIGVPLAALYVYVEMPALVFPQAFVLLAVTLVPNAAYAALRPSALQVPRNLRGLRVARVARRRGPGLATRGIALDLPYAVLLGALAIFALALAIAPFADASGLRDLAAVSTSDHLPASADVHHLRVVPQEAAEFAGDKIIGQLGAYYRVGRFDIEAVGGRLVWVAPLEFQGIVQWLVRHTSPGAIVVGAESADAPAELHLRGAMQFVPSAYLNDNLYRHVYFRYGTEQILDTILQIDASGDPQYIATLGRPTIGFSGQRITAVVIVDPVTGKMLRYDRADFSRLPAWISRIVPPRLALSYNEWFGRYVHGFWNSVIARRDVHVPARDDVFGILANDRFVWFADHTSPASDRSMTGFTYLDSVTGDMTYFTSSGGEFNSLGAEDAVASNPIVKQGRLLTTQPILYTVSEKNTWVVPLVADTGKVQSLALVEAANGHVTVGTSTSVSPQADAFAQYEAFLDELPGATQPIQTSVAGVIDRIASTSASSVVFTLIGHRSIYRLDATDDPFALLAREGDDVRFRVDVVGSADGAMEAREFVDRAFSK